MTLALPITRERVRNHFTYGLWKYALLILLAIFGWDLLYTTTAYRPPAEKRVDFYISGGASANSDMLDALMTTIQQDVLPDMELVDYVTLLSGGADDMYANIQLTTYIMAGEGDVYMLPEADFQNMASNGAMIDLAPYVENGALHAEGIDLKKGYVTNAETGEKALYGIPAKALEGLSAYGLHGEKAYLSVTLASGNEENAVKFLDYLLTNLRNAPEAAPEAAPAT